MALPHMSLSVCGPFKGQPQVYQGLPTGLAWSAIHACAAPDSVVIRALPHIPLLLRKGSTIYSIGCTLICDVERVYIVTAGFQRTVTVALDTAQYQLDMEYMQEHKSEDVYSTFNLLMRRKPKVVTQASAFCFPVSMCLQQGAKLRQAWPVRGMVHFSSGDHNILRSQL